MAKYYTINKTTKKLCGILGFGSNSNRPPKHDENTILIAYNEELLDGLTFDEFHKSKKAVIIDNEVLGWQDDPTYDKDSETKEKLVKEYTSGMVNSIVIGSLESALDLVVQMLDKWINDKVPTKSEISKWNSFFSANKTNFKSTLAKLTQKEIENMALLKFAARKTQKSMMEDERWPKS